MGLHKQGEQLLALLAAPIRCLQVYNNPAYGDASKSCFQKYQDDIGKPGKTCEAANDLAFCLAIATTVVEECADNDVEWWVCERASRRSHFDNFCGS